MVFDVVPDFWRLSSAEEIQEPTILAEEPLFVKGILE